MVPYINTFEKLISTFLCALETIVRFFTKDLAYELLHY